jgi:hypothetical protein
LAYWHASAERAGKRLPGSDLDAIEAASAESAARRAIRQYWIERRNYFEDRGTPLREITVVISEHLPAADPEGDTTAPTRGPASRWVGKVATSQSGSELDAAAAFDRTQMVAVTVERLANPAAGFSAP